MKKIILILGMMMLLTISFALGAECDGTWTDMPCEITSGIKVISEDLSGINVTLNGGDLEIRNFDVDGNIYVNSSSSGIKLYNNNRPVDAYTSNIDLNVVILANNTNIDFYELYPHSYNIVNDNNYDVHFRVDNYFDVESSAPFTGIFYESIYTGVQTILSGEIAGGIIIPNNRTIIIDDSSNSGFDSWTAELDFIQSGVNADNYTLLLDGTEAILNVDYTESYVGGDYIALVVSKSGNWTITEPLNTAPVINSISPDERIELKHGEFQIYTSDVTDNDGDAEYNWTLGGIEVSIIDTYTADWDDITPGIYTLQLEVSDAEYNDIISTTLEIRARGGSATGMTTRTESTTNVVTGNQEKIVPKKQKFMERLQLKVQNFGRSISRFFNRFVFWKK